MKKVTLKKSLIAAKPNQKATAQFIEFHSLFPPYQSLTVSTATR